MCGDWLNARGRRRLLVAGLLALALPAWGDDKPMGAPLELSTIETEQPVPLAVLSPDGKTASCVTIKLHWTPKVDVGPDDDATSFSLDLPPDNPAGPIFMAQLWNASLASAQAWQQPWQGARWKILQTPSTDGSGLDAELAVAMIATAARRPYPKEATVIGTLNPDGSLGAVSRIIDRMDAAAAAGVTRIIIPSVQRFETDGSGNIVELAKHADEIHVECVPVDNLVAATEAVMHDPLPETTLTDETPKYPKPVADYIDDFARREQTEATSGLQFAPHESDLAHYPPRTAATWKSIYSDIDQAQQAYHGGQVYVAYLLFARANGRMHGINALAGQNRTTFDVKTALATADGLHQQLHDLMNPPTIDKGDLVSALLVAEMADWAFGVRASLEGAQLVTKQAFSQRSDATDAEKDRAREAILFANDEAKYLLAQADFYNGLWGKLNTESLAPVEENAAHLLPQLIPAQLATAQVFTEGIRSRASDLRDGLLFDPQLVAYVNVLREAKAAWDARERKREIEGSGTGSGSGSTKPSGSGPAASVGFDPGNTYAPPHTVVVPTGSDKKLTDVSRCLIWVNDDCEIATLDEKYVRLSGALDPTTHEWHMKDKARLDALLQAAENGARRGIVLANKVGLDPTILAMIYERASHLRAQGEDANSLEALRQYWRCALLGNMCWQLAHTHKAQPVDLSADDKSKGKDKDKDGKKADDKTAAKGDEKKSDNSTAATTNAPASKPPEVAKDDGAAKDKAADSSTSNAPSAKPPEVAKDDASAKPKKPDDDADSDADKKPAPRAMPVTDDSTTNAPTVVVAPQTPPVSPAPPTVVDIDPDKIPVAKVAKPEDYGGDSGTTTNSALPVTNAAPLIGPTAP